MSTFSMNGFPVGAEPGTPTWTNFWENESVGVTPGTRIPEFSRDYSPYEQVTTRQAETSPVIGAASVAAWYESVTAPESDAPLY